MKLNNLVPMLNVSDIERSLDFYRKALGFEVVSEPDKIKEWKWATLKSGETELMISESEQGPSLRKGVDSHNDASWPCVYYFYPEDVDALHRHIIACGFEPTALENTFYGMREFSMQDPDGHLLNFGQDEDES